MKTLAHDPRFKFNGRDGSYNDAVVVREIWCENVYEVSEDDVSDTKIVVDIGANIGSFSLFAAGLGATKVLMVEPEPDNLRLLTQNIEEHKHLVEPCEFILRDVGVAGQEGTGYINSQHGGSSIHSEADGGWQTAVMLTTLDKLFAKHALDYIDVLKVDVEGMEGEILLAAPERTLKLCRYITIEYDQHSGNLGQIVEKLVATHQVKVVGNQGGMIFARRY